ncbi:MAG: S-layer homology domain-containing protein [bacterium]
MAGGKESLLGKESSSKMGRLLPLLLVALILFSLAGGPTTLAEGEDFRLLLLPSRVELGFDSTVTVSLILLGEGQTSASLAVNGLPAGLSALINPTTLTLPGVAILTLSTAPPYAPGSYTIEVTASAAGQLKVLPMTISNKKSLELSPAAPYTYTWETGTATLGFFLYDDSSTSSPALTLETSQPVTYQFSPPRAVAAETFQSTLSISPQFSKPGVYPMNAQVGSAKGQAQAAFSFILLFPDTRGHWGSAAIAQLLPPGIISGYPDGTFQPESPLTRAEMAKILSLGFELPLTRSGTLPFRDLEPGYWATPYIERLWKAEIVEGYPDGGYHPSAPVTRAELAAMIDRVFRWPSIPANYAPTFTDLSATDWAFLPIESGAWQGAWDGYPDGAFHPQSLATRAEVAALVARLLPSPLN